MINNSNLKQKNEKEIIIINSKLTGTNIVGMSKTRSRVAEDFYSTPQSSTIAILNKEILKGSILEPAAGQGHISTILHKYYPQSEIISTDLVKREDKFNCNIQSGINFLTYNFNRKFDNIVTNPPFKLGKEFVERALELSNDKVLLFLKLQFLESKSRKEMFSHTPLKYVYVFSERQSPYRNGQELNEKGKPWSSVMCFAWFVWQHGYQGEPMIRWL